MENELLTSNLRGQRTIATVVFTDCVGFSARMSVDEDLTLELIRRDLKLIKDFCAHREGRVLKFTGDGLMMCFSDPIQAVKCAIDVQEILTEKAKQLTPNQVLRHRIGIHLADVFITENDVMGNGVNIAARLQTQAEPGGICLSQSVYDVVNGQTHHRICYLGPKELKNIREVVPVYKVILQPETEPVDIQDSILRQLQEQPELARIKKLLFYACRQQWQHDPNQISDQELADLIRTICQRATSPQQLQQLLNQAIQSLSKADEYCAIGDLIWQIVTPIYAVNPLKNSISSLDSADDTRMLTTPLQAPDHSTLYTSIASAIEQTSQASRVHRLLFYICRQRWVKDMLELERNPLIDLVQEIHHLAPTPEQLSQLVNQFVQTLNKRVEYALIANILMGKMSPLYVSANELSSNLVADYTNAEYALPEPAPTVDFSEQDRLYYEVAADLDRDPQQLRIKKLMLYTCRMQWESDPEVLQQHHTATLVQELHSLALNPGQLHTALYAVIRTLSKPAEYELVANTILAKLQSLYTTGHTIGKLGSMISAPLSLDRADVSNQTALTISSLPPALSVAPIAPPVPKQEVLPAVRPTSSQQSRTPSLLDTRLEMIKYNNPLKVKILLFSALYSDFQFTHQDWLNLKMHELEGLLRSLLIHCPVYTDLELLLYSKARDSEDPEDTLMMTDRILKCLRPFYLYGNPGQMVGAEDNHEKTHIALDLCQATQLEVSTFSDDVTCQLPN